MNKRVYYLSIFSIALLWGGIIASHLDFGSNDAVVPEIEGNNESYFFTQSDSENQLPIKKEPVVFIKQVAFVGQDKDKQKP